VTDGHIPVIGHHSQQQIIHTSKNAKEGHLCHTAHIGDNFFVKLNIHNHVWDSGRDEADVSQGQIGEEKVHGGVEVGDIADGQDDEQIPKHC
jgi:hypothetical protein